MNDPNQDHFDRGNEYCRQLTVLKHHSKFDLNQSPIKLFKLFILNFLIHFSHWKFNHRFNHPRSSFIIVIFLFILISSISGQQQSTCPNAKQINDLKPPNVNLNCDCTQIADGHKTGWEIQCYSVENLHNG